ncbi:MBL fold metallo-hydrolase [Inmirania thermothiophila]|uniref:Glyoxylase-like metal-dependent hydrolase (Beta-lactamase superfamily II) n=1 Tax=Inmirania thermothiophila TaxID=1750597 RepID=A0A3N1Y7Y6_9GAMM|nr:MBL fold metallo-hydrolase [Inmirania thermothiophila]ROR34621.1 glyoxylase-like metal-dependent hydrolase (beta-lactamase superfamily II) [Inmirania thermothiophila]
MSEGVRIEALELGPMENLVYLVQDAASGRAAVVDPAWEVERVLALAGERGVRITDILLTHSHHDHVNGIERVLEATDAQLHLLRDEARFWGAELPRPTLHHGGDRIRLGETEIEVLHTPGHTPGSACYRIGDHLITGDTLFVFGCGRCDLRGGDPEAMFATLRRLRDGLPDETVIHPGHRYAEPETSTLGEQKRGNPFLHFNRLEDFVRYRMVEHDRIRSTPYRPVPPEAVRGRRSGPDNAPG